MQQKISKSGIFVKALLWNMGGMCFYYLCRWLINISVVRMASDFGDAGILALAVSITGIWNVVALFSVRNIQVSDIDNDYTDSEYVSARIITVLAAIVLCVCHAFIFTKNTYQALVITTYMIMAASVTFADVMHGILQKKWRMDIIGISYILRGIALIVPFTLLYYFFGLLPAVLGMAFFSIIIALTYDMQFAQKAVDIKIHFAWQRLRLLLSTCFPLVVVAFLSTLIPSITRMALEKITDTETLGIYGSVTLPANIIQMVVISVFAPFTNVFTRFAKEGTRKKFTAVLWVGVFCIAIFFVVFYIMTYPFGSWLMQLLFGPSMEKYTYLFREATFICFLASLSLFIVIPLTVLRYQKTIMIVFTVGIAFCTSFLNCFIYRYGASGANYVQIVGYAIIAATMLITVTIFIRKAFKDRSND